MYRLSLWIYSVVKYIIIFSLTFFALSLMFIFGGAKEQFDKKFDSAHYLTYNNIMSQFYRKRIRTT